MPSWNIHTAHVERLLADCEPDDLGIEDVNAFLFGNYVPDIYLGFMVADITFHVDYCRTWPSRTSRPFPTLIISGICTCAATECPLRAARWRWGLGRT